MRSYHGRCAGEHASDTYVDLRSADERLPHEIMPVALWVIVDDTEDFPAEMLVEPRACLERERIELRVRTTALTSERLRCLEQTAPVTAAAERLVDPQDRDVQAARPRAPQDATADGAVLVAQDDRHRTPVRDAGPLDVPEREPVA